jgi:NTE family protein
MLTLSDRRTKTGLVLGAGGLVGEAYEAGVLAALQDDLRWDARTADLIVGTSAGSIVGSLLRCGLSPKDMYAFEANRPMSARGTRLLATALPPDIPTLRFPRRPRVPSASMIARAMRHPWGSRAALLCAALPTGRIDATPFTDKLRVLTGESWPEKDLWIVAAKLPFGERVVFGTRGCPPCDVADAAGASCAVPGVFAPVHIDGRLYVDGGVHSPTNVDVLVDEPLDTVVVVSPMSASRPSLRNRRVNPMRLFFRALLVSEVRRLRAQGTAVIVFQPGADAQRVMGINGFDSGRCARVAEVAYEQTIARLARPRMRDAAAALAA